MYKILGDQLQPPLTNTTDFLFGYQVWKKVAKTFNQVSEKNKPSCVGTDEDENMISSENLENDLTLSQFKKINNYRQAGRKQLTL